MARVKIQLPKDFLFETVLQVRIGDVNYGGHLGNDSVLSLVQEARLQFFYSLGYSELDFGGAGVIMTDAIVSYKAEASYGDEITVKIGVEEISKVTFDLVYEMINQASKQVAVVKTGMMSYDYVAKKMISIPEEVKEKLNG